MTPQDIFTRVQRLFGDEASVQVQLTDVVMWINDAQREIVMQHDNLLQVEGFLSSVAGQRDYALPINLYTLQSLAYLDGNSWVQLSYLSPRAVAEYLNGLDGTDSQMTPVFFTRGYTENNLTLVPYPNVTGINNLRIIYSRYPVNLLSETDPIDLPLYYHNAVLEYCMMKSYEMDENWEAADRKAAVVQGTIRSNQGKQEAIAKQTYPMITPVYEDYN